MRELPGFPVRFEAPALSLQSGDTHNTLTNEGFENLSAIQARVDHTLFL